MPLPALVLLMIFIFLWPIELGLAMIGARNMKSICQYLVLWYVESPYLKSDYAVLQCYGTSETIMGDQSIHTGGDCIGK